MNKSEKIKRVGIAVDSYKTTMYASALIEAKFEILDTMRHSDKVNVLVIAVKEKDIDVFTKLVKKIEDAIRAGSMSRLNRQERRSRLRKNI